LENLEADIETVEYTPEENFSIENYKEALQSVKEKLGALGSVNFLALEEFDAQSNRLRFYNEQCSDLIQSEKHLQETISEINLNAERMFEETFNQINSNFQMLFTKLFGESGYAELKLADGNVLEADIEINAKPPGKKPHSIDMLSGGEKTLTAISLLFGIYLVKPSPFCILDEVDAPLDDANIDRFLNLIREFSVETQFIFITHNKKTMEAASTLYGITMQEQGVSKVVSVKIQKNFF
jgi:chromosome segregation protein